jgi:pimeloyl-ACP methyl ester carboxylesterase
MAKTVLSQCCRLSYEVRGAGDPIVFIQGVGLHGGGWLPQTDSLTFYYLCLTFDNRGMGHSQPVGAPVTVEQMAADTLAIMDAEGIHAAHLVGHSLGGVVALQVALTSRAKVRSLSLLCTSARGADATRLAPEIIWPGIRSRVGTRRMRRHAFLEIVMPPAVLAAQNRDALAESLAPFFGHDLADSPRIVNQQLNALKSFDATPRLAELTGIPTLVLSAACDIIFPPRFGRALAAGIPGARHVEIPNAAHGVTIQSADDVNKILLEHFAALPPHAVGICYG